jgi:iron complex outermembrane receptor protein
MTNTFTGRTEKTGSGGSLFAIPALVLTCISPPASAQAGALEEVIVTATKQSASLQNVPVTVNAFTDQVIQEAGIANAYDLAIMTPSLNIAINVQPFTARFQIRGVGTAQTDIALEPSVGLFIDEVYLGRSGLGMSDLTDIERIEVLQGPQGTLYGKNTNAGAISIITKAPNSEESEGYVEASIGDYNLRKVTISATGPLSKKLAYRLSGNVHRRDGFLENAGGDDLNDADDWNLIGKLLYQPTDSLEFLLNASHVERNSKCCGADSIQSDSVNTELARQGYSLDRNDPFDYKIDVNVASDFELDSDALSLVIDYRQDWGSIKSITAWNDASGSSDSDDDRSQLDIFSRVDGISSGDSFSQELRFSSSATAQLDYQLGLFYYEQTTDGGDGRPYVFLGDDFITIASQQDLSSLPGLPAGIPIGFVARPGDSISADVELQTQTIAVFGQSTWHISERSRITGGLRWTEEEKRADLRVAVNSTAPSTALPGEPSLLKAVTTPIDDNFKRTSSDMDWLLKVSLDASDDVMVFASAATGTKSGGFNTVNGSVDEREFDDESTISYELGIKSMLLDSRLRLNATVFYSEVQDYQVQQQLDTGAGTRVDNQGEIRTSGLDFDLQVLPLPNLTVNAGLLYMHEAQVTEGPQKGLHLPWAPDYSANLSATLVLPLAGGGLYIRGDYSYMDDHLTNASPETDDDDIQDRNLLNARIGWRNNRWNISLWGKNLTEDDYASLTANTFVFSGMDAFFLAPPRTYGATVRYDF